MYKPVMMVAWGLTLSAGAVVAQQDRPVRRPNSIYRDTSHGFSITPPPFAGQTAASSQIVTMFAPPAHQFASNVNVTFLPITTTRSEYLKSTRKGLRAKGGKLISKKMLSVSGKDAVLFDYEVLQAGRVLRFLAMAVIDTDGVFSITCTAPKNSFGQYERAFRVSLDSFRLED